MILATLSMAIHTCIWSFDPSTKIMPGSSLSFGELFLSLALEELESLLISYS